MDLNLAFTHTASILQISHALDPFTACCESVLFDEKFRLKIILLNSCVNGESLSDHQGP